MRRGRDYGIVIEERHDSTLMRLGVFVLVLAFSAALTLLAWAIWQLSTALSLAVVALGIGGGVSLAAAGAAAIIEAMGQAGAAIIEARGRARATLERERQRALEEGVPPGLPENRVIEWHWEEVSNAGHRL